MARTHYTKDFLKFDKVRICLRCDKEFNSYGGARLCKKCNEINAVAYVPHESHVPQHLSGIADTDRQ